MKKGLLKRASLALCTVLLAGLVQIPSFAEVTYSYNHDYDSAEDFAQSGMKLADASSNPYEITNEYGLCGKESTDGAAVINPTGISATESKQIGYEIPYYAYKFYNEIDKQGIARTIEFSMLYGGDADSAVLQSRLSTHPSNWRQWQTVYDFVKIEKSIVTVNGKDTGIRCGKNEWLRVAVEEYYNAEKINVYINGVKISGAFSGFLLGNLWTKIALNYNAADGTAERNGKLAVDNLKIYEGEYALSESEKIEYSVSGVNYVSDYSLILCSGSENAEDILSAVNTENEKWMQVSHTNPERITSGNIQNGNVIVMRSADGKTFKYITVSTNPDDAFISKDGYYNKQFGNTDGLSMAWDTNGIFGKTAADAKSLLLTAENLSPNGGSDRYNFMGLPSSVFSTQSFTAEFSVAASGDVDSLIFINRSVFANHTDKGYVNVLAMSEKDGIIADHGNTYVMPFVKDRWYRIAVTYYPQTAQYDIYVNGTKYGEKLSLGLDGGILKNFEWFQLQPVYNKIDSAELRNGKVAVSDLLLYYGKYQDKAENKISVSSSLYNIDENLGKLYIDGNVDIIDFTDNFVTNCEYRIYTDSTYSAEAEDILPGEVVVVRSANGYSFKYYTIESASVTMDSLISTYVNGEESNMILNDGDVLKAVVNMSAPAYLNKKSALVLAIYKNGALYDVAIDEKAIDGSTSFEVSKQIELASGMSAKAMFLDSIVSIKPYLSAAVFENFAE